MKNKKYIYYFILNFFLLINSFSGVLSKLAAAEPFLSFKYILFYILMLFLLMIYSVVWQQILKKISLTSAYANKAVAIIWTMLWANIFFKESITLNMIIGVIVIIIGVGLVVTSDE